MSTSENTASSGSYYDPSEVEAYVREATATIKALQARLQDEVRRAEQAEHALGDYHPESAGLGRALLLAGEVADKTIGAADERASEIVSEAEAEATRIMTAAKAEAARIVEGARSDTRRAVETAEEEASRLFHDGKARLLSAISTFVDGVEVLRAQLNQADAARPVRSPAPSAFPPAETGRPGTADDDDFEALGPPVPRESRPPRVDAGSPINVAPFQPPSFSGGRRTSERPTRP